MRLPRPALLCFWHLRFWNLGLLTLAVASSALAAPAEDADKSSAEKVQLQYKFKMGQVLRYQVKHEANVTTTLEETTQDVESVSDSVKAWKVTDVLPNGEIEFMHVVESIKMTNRQPQQGVAKYDSTTGEQPPAIFQQAASAVGVPMTLIRMTPTGKIVHREEKHPQPEVTKDMPITLEMSGKPIAVGEQWDHDYEVPVDRKNGGKQQVRTRRLCKLTSVKSGVATIEVTYQVLTPIDPFVKSQLLERMTKGTVRFDIAEGRVLSQRHEVDRRVLGFAGKTSSMHFVSRLEEKLIKEGASKAKVARR
ncbi:hypothetical protein [Adhaeretor mobilis]|uniref:Uncharacterized protein n=1 Tax=Adhaeretor mobilis TaxID=1930276 RepID=A0A517N037_9BACT|nr:hypothetical protein [Adhaeretor mobilis]QDT00502.1 hypothetical protein HG15A2_38400 [Adhaeretor mobilis]